MSKETRVGHHQAHSLWLPFASWPRPEIEPSWEAMQARGKAALRDPHSLPLADIGTRSAAWFPAELSRHQPHALATTVTRDSTTLPTAWSRSAKARWPASSPAAALPRCRFVGGLRFLFRRRPAGVLQTGIAMATLLQAKSQRLNR